MRSKCDDRIGRIRDDSSGEKDGVRSLRNSCRGEAGAERDGRGVELFVPLVFARSRSEEDGLTRVDQSKLEKLKLT